MVGTTELESVTFCMSSKRSNQLSYAPVNQLYYHNLIFLSCQHFLCKEYKIFLKKFLKPCHSEGAERPRGSAFVIQSEAKESHGGKEEPNKK